MNMHIHIHHKHHNKPFTLFPLAMLLTSLQVKTPMKLLDITLFTSAVLHFVSCCLVIIAQSPVVFPFFIDSLIGVITLPSVKRTSNGFHGTLPGRPAHLTKTLYQLKISQCKEDFSGTKTHFHYGFPYYFE